MILSSSVYAISLLPSSCCGNAEMKLFEVIYPVCNLSIRGNAVPIIANLLLQILPHHRNLPPIGNYTFNYYFGKSVIREFENFQNIFQM